MKDLRWTSNGEKICIAYDDGAVIVGSVDGNRLWGKELSMQLSLLHWSPDSRFILFANATGECHTYDSNGNAVAKVPLYCNEGYVGKQMSQQPQRSISAATAVTSWGRSCANLPMLRISGATLGCSTLCKHTDRIKTAHGSSTVFQHVVTRPTAPLLPCCRSVQDGWH